MTGWDQGEQGAPDDTLYIGAIPVQREAPVGIIVWCRNVVETGGV